MDSIFSKYREVVLLDFEFSAPPGELPIVRCLVAKELKSGRFYKYWADQLGSNPPFETDDGVLLVSYYALAELACFESLGWPAPTNVLDLYVEFRCLTNGRYLKDGNGLLGALKSFGHKTEPDIYKTQMRELAIRGGEYSEDEKNALIEYCLSDVLALETLLRSMRGYINQHSLIRGRYIKALSSTENLGIPIDADTLNRLRVNWDYVQERLIETINEKFHVFEGRTFKRAKFEEYLVKNKMRWPKLPSGVLDLSDDTFLSMAKTYPQIKILRDVRSALAKMRKNSLYVGSDGRNRCMLSPFKSITARNQPSNSKWIFGMSAWFRALIKPRQGFAVAYIDWSQQEFGIAAALSKDKNMMAAYRSGDPYLTFAIQAGGAPIGATKASHPKERELFKACILATQYGMGAQALSLKVNKPLHVAQELLRLHRKTYKDFWKWSDSVLDTAMAKGVITTRFGWRLNVPKNANFRSIRNFKMQANGSEILRVACILAAQKNVKTCATVHDALLIEAPTEIIEEQVAITQDCMRQASAIVLDGFELGSDVKIVKWPDRYIDPRGIEMWEMVMKFLDESCASMQHGMSATAHQLVAVILIPSLLFILGSMV